VDQVTRTKIRNIEKIEVAYTGKNGEVRVGGVPRCKRAQVDVSDAEVDLPVSAAKENVAI
jgi:hypothetical protein